MEGKIINYFFKHINHFVVNLKKISLKKLFPNTVYITPFICGPEGSGQQKARFNKIVMVTDVSLTEMISLGIKNNM